MRFFSERLKLGTSSPRVSVPSAPARRTEKGKAKVV
jgi:hypothetical protein